MTTMFHDEAAFFEAWRTGVALAGERYFGDRTHFPTTATSKWDLEPRVESITKALGVLSSGEPCFWPHRSASMTPTPAVTCSRKSAAPGSATLQLASTSSGAGLSLILWSPTPDGDRCRAVRGKCRRGRR